MSDTIFISGASGQLGQLVIKHLLALGVTHNRIIAGTRRPETLAGLAAAHIEVRKTDFDDPQGLTEAFNGVGTALIISTDALDGAGTRLKQHRDAVSSALAAGVKHLAYTSMPNPQSSLVSFAPDHLQTERAIKDAGLPYTIFRNGWYQENLLMSLPNAFKSGQWYSAAEGGRVSYVAREDIAQAIATALIAATSASRTYTLTGPQALSIEEIADLARLATGKPLAVVPVTEVQLAASMTEAGVPAIFVSLLISIEAEVRAGNLSITTDHLESLLGRSPKRLGDYLKEAKAQYAV